MLNPLELGETHNIPTRNPQSLLHSFDLSRCGCAFQNGCGNIFSFFLKNSQFTKSRWVLCTMSETVPTYLTTKEVLAHLRVGRDALRSWRNDSERYGVFCPCVNIARPPRVMYQWGTGRDNPYREIERWRDAIAACRKSHKGRNPNGYTPRPVVTPPKALHICVALPSHNKK